MTVLYESIGSFNTESPSYMSLISNRSRGTITLNEKNLSFETEVDKIVFQVKLSEIQNFFMRFRFFIPYIELKTVNKTIYALYPLREGKYLYSSSLLMTEELFRQLVRIIYNKDQPILFDSVGVLYPGSLQSFDVKENFFQGHVFLTENYILFKSFQTGDISNIKIVNIKLIIIEIVNSTRYLTIETIDGRVFSFLILKEKRRKFVKDKVKTEKFYDILNNAKIYKDSEKLLKEKEEKKHMKCLYCGNTIDTDDATCPYCGNII